MGKLPKNHADFRFYQGVLEGIKLAAEQRQLQSLNPGPYLLSVEERVVVAKFEKMRDEAAERMKQDYSRV